MTVWPHITPSWVDLLFPGLVWRLEGSGDPTVYLSFDDGPHPQITPWVLDCLDEVGAKATFFCVGANAERYPALVAEIQRRGHEVGNHTHRHLNGWKNGLSTYTKDVKQASEHLSTPLFRPPYGKIFPWQYAALRKDYRVIMWSVLTCDYNRSIDGAQCLENALVAGNGDIVLFHDSEKAEPNLRYALPKWLQAMHQRGLLIRSVSSGLSNHAS
ncbi:MAG TPA: polysaccharide deacetylase family protein [Luteibaculaceae bacterium]|nr:polysaccharide deacetylase family protein [Luteibaculaceae bacterium]